MRTDERLKIIYETAASMVTRTPETWAKYLAFASRIYKYPFDNALLVYAQDPSASMLATKEIWGRVGRSPADKAKQIAVCEYKNAKNSLKYLLDVTQTVGGVTPQQWKADKNMQTSLALALSERYNLDNPYLDAVIGQFVHATMEQSFEQYMQDFELDIEGHFFAELPKEGLYAQIREITEASARIFVSSRCKIDLIDSDMQAISTISHFDTIPLVARLGNVVTDVSKHILLEVYEVFEGESEKKFVYLLDEKLNFDTNAPKEKQYNSSDIFKNKWYNVDTKKIKVNTVVCKTFLTVVASGEPRHILRVLAMD